MPRHKGGDPDLGESSWGRQYSHCVQWVVKRRQDDARDIGAKPEMARLNVVYE